MSKIKHLISQIKLSTPSAIILGAIILAVSHVGYGYVISKNQSNSNATFFTGKLIDDKDYIWGNKKSDVIVMEYSDPECPYCVQFHSTVKQMQEEYKDKISFVYRHFPLTQIHSNAFDEARAISCAGKVGGDEGYFNYINNFFDYKLKNQTTQLPKNGKENIAKEVNLNIESFNACMTNKDTEQDVTDSLNDGVAAGVEGTPATFVLLKNSKGYEVIAKIDGARQYSFVKAAIEQALSR